MVKLGGERDTLAGHMPPRRIESAQVERLVRHALDRVAHEHDRDAILRIALLNAGERDIPKKPGPLTAFVLGPLREAVVEFVGESGAVSMVRSLKPLLKMKSELELPVAEEDARHRDRPSVIVVDSDSQTRARLVAWLREDGFNAVSAADAMIALAMSVRRRPDVLVLDVDLDTTTRQVEGLLGVAFGEQAPPLLLLSAYTHEGEATLAKPVERGALVDAVRGLHAAASA